MNGVGCILGVDDWRKVHLKQSVWSCNSYLYNYYRGAGPTKLVGMWEARLLHYYSIEKHKTVGLVSLLAHWLEAEITGRGLVVRCQIRPLSTGRWGGWWHDLRAVCVKFCARERIGAIDLFIFLEMISRHDFKMKNIQFKLTLISTLVTTIKRSIINKFRTMF